ncbi:DUF6766 family protein [Arthrobacter sp. D2-10]
MRILRNNGISIFFGLIFLLALTGQALTGHALENEEKLAEGQVPVGFLEYISSSTFAVDVSENWQSEYLQFLLYILATVWFVQKGSPESKSLEDVGRETDQEQRVGEYADEDSPRWAKAKGWRLAVYSSSLGLVMGVIFLLSWAVQFITGRVAYNEERITQGEPPLDVWGYLGAPEFWNRTFQNWQSEFLAVGSMAVLAIYLRQRGSAESKPVGAPHQETSAEG